jgi:sugar lactone lactonase YvrE
MRVFGFDTSMYVLIRTSSFNFLTNMTASLLIQLDCYLGEGSYWHSGRNSLFFVDIERKALYEYSLSNSSLKKREMPARVSVIMQDTQGALILGLQGGIASFDLQSEKLDWLLALEKDIPTNRTNDGGIDAKGRMWIGTLDVKLAAGKGALYCIGNDLAITQKMDNCTISNGLTWSLDGQRMYYIDTPLHTVQSYFFDVETGNISFEKNAVTIPKETGAPDGMCIDEEGMLWVALYHSGTVCRFNPHTGDLIDKVEFPAPHVTSCAFGGPELDHLFITTAQEKMSEDDLKKYPLSGSVFVVKPGVKGVRTNAFIH